MSGIYIHVPYCKRKCDYCDFYSISTTGSMEQYVLLVNKELEMRRGYLPAGNVSTIYFGGGTPSLLSAHEVFQILQAAKRFYSIKPDAEVTFEANPDDLTPLYLRELKDLGVNRLSMGVQSFNDKDLTALGRRHSGQQAEQAVTWAQEVGLENVSIDLIYGLPYSSSKVWLENLQKAAWLGVKHLSCYHLIVEEGTPLHRRVNEGKVRVVEEDLSVEQFAILQTFAKANGYVHYEISNLGKVGYFSLHNSSYWKQVPYLGVGPAAHSFCGHTRDWNPKSINHWAKKISMGLPAAKTELLSPTDKINDYLLTSLRTMWGADLGWVKENFGPIVAQTILTKAKRYLQTEYMCLNDGVLTINPNHFITSDGIISDLFE